VAAASVWVFLALANEVIEGHTRALDERLLLALRTPGAPSDPLGPPWLKEAGRDFTALGGTGVIVFLVVAVTLFLALTRRRAEAVILVVASLGALGLELMLNGWYDRQPSARCRPALNRNHASRSICLVLGVQRLLLQGQLLLDLGAGQVAGLGGRLLHLDTNGAGRLS
jgi:hypothetical protein